MDHADIATEIIETCTADALRRGLGKSAPESHPDFNGFDCVECGNEIPSERLDWGKVRCVECQERLEKENQMRPYNVTAQ